ncbi:MAG: DUF4870 domain-containing protein [Streptosporangiaceae bacterium]
MQALIEAGDREQAAGRPGRRAASARAEARRDDTARDDTMRADTMRADTARDGDEAWVMLGYLGVPFVSFLAPLAVYLGRARHSAFARRHAAQALNLSITLVLYNLCVLILAGILALDAVGVALLVAGPVVLALWLAALYFLSRAAISASRGEFYAFPRWICATLTR